MNGVLEGILIKYLKTLSEREDCAWRFCFFHCFVYFRMFQLRPRLGEELTKKETEAP